jgi:hypothetical protein
VEAGWRRDGEDAAVVGAHDLVAALVDQPVAVVTEQDEVGRYLLI